MSNAVAIAQYGSNNPAWRNRIINGDMRIDQRNNGASVTPTNGQYLVDRWFAILSQASKFSAQQNAGSVSPPTGFTNYEGVTSLSAYSVLAGDFFGVSQKIEGFNCADLAWGTANAQSVTLSFWVRSSLTGTFGGSVQNNAFNRSYPFTYTISAANTWEQKSVTIAGDTSGTWLTNNSTGIGLIFGLGAGATFSGTAGSWAAGNFVQPTGTVSVVGTNGATFYITGVQLEAGTNETPFERRDYGRELIMCQRYCPVADGQNSASAYFAGGVSAASIQYVAYSFKVTPRVPPTGISVSSASHFACYNGIGSGTASSVTYQNASNDWCLLNIGGVSFSAGSSVIAYFTSTSGKIIFTGCEL